MHRWTWSQLRGETSLPAHHKGTMPGISLAQARPFPFRSADRFQQGHFIFSKDITILRSNKVSLLSVGLAGENPDLPTAAVKALSMSLDLSNLHNYIQN